MKTKYQIFVSSTFEDLKGERDQVTKAILEMGHIPVGMEMFSAGDEEQWNIIARTICEVDYYVVIVAHRYGSMVAGKSYTEKEYDYAKKMGKPTLGFVIDSQASWPAAKMESDPIAIASLGRFKDKVKSKMVNFWKNSEDLHGKVSIALMKQFTANPQVGWVRASPDVSGELAAELTRLSKENSDLRISLEQAKVNSQTEQDREYSEVMRVLEGNRIQFSIFFKGGSAFEVSPEDVSMAHVFDITAPELIIEKSSEGMSKYWALMYNFDDARNVRDNWPVASNTTRMMIADFVALELFEPSNRVHAPTDEKEYWTLSEFGKGVLAFRRKLKLIAKAASHSERVGRELSNGGELPVAKKVAAPVAKKAAAPVAKKAAAP
ncbi:DUF4062 domain-containing protein, partial [Luteolibacter flavescens]